MEKDKLTIEFRGSEGRVDMYLDDFLFQSIHFDTKDDGCEVAVGVIAQMMAIDKYPSHIMFDLFMDQGLNTMRELFFEYNFNDNGTVDWNFNNLVESVYEFDDDETKESFVCRVIQECCEAMALVNFKIGCHRIGAFRDEYNRLLVMNGHEELPDGDDMGDFADFVGGLDFKGFEKQ